MESILSCFWSLVCLGLIVLVVVLSSRSSNNQQQKILSKVLLIQWLKNMKEKGYKTIDELLNMLEPPIPEHSQTQQVSNIEDNAPRPTPQSIPERNNDNPVASVKVIEKHSERIPKPANSKPIIHISNAVFMLYLGSALVLFAVFLFVAFNWQSFTPIIKSTIIIVLIAAFYCAGILCSNHKSLKQAANTFYFIGSVTLGLGGIGLWNFNSILFEQYNIKFSSYWLFYSILLVTINGLSYYLLKSKSYISLTIISIYSIVISIAYTFATDYKFRVVIIALLNLAIYSLNLETNPMHKMLKLISTAINYLLDIVIFIIILGLANEIYTSADKFIALIALMIPSIFQILSSLKSSQKFELHLLAITFPIKLVLITNLYNLDFVYSIFIFAIYATFITIIKEFTNSLMNQTLEITKWIISIICILLLMLPNNSTPELTILNNIAMIILCGSLIIPYSLKPNPKVLSIGLVTIIPLALELFITQDTRITDRPTVINNIFIGLVLLANTGTVYLHYVHKKLDKIFVPIIAIASLSLFVSSIILESYDRLFISLTLLTVTGYLFKQIYNSAQSQIEQILKYIGLIGSNLISTLTLLIVWVAASNIHHEANLLLVVTAISILPILNLIRGFEGKPDFESLITLVLIPFQLLGICMLYKLSFENTIIIFTLYSIVKVLTSEYYIKSGHFKLHVISQIIYWIILAITTLLSTSAMIELFNLNLSNFTIFFVYLANLLTFNLPALLLKRKEVLTITLNYILLFSFRMLGLIVNADNVESYLALATVLHLGGLTGYLYLNKLDRKDFTLLPFTILSTLALILSILDTTFLYQTIGFLIIGITSSIIANFHSNDRVRYLSLASFFVTTNFFAGYIIDILPPAYMNIEAYIPLINLIPAIVYMIIYEINHKSGKIHYSNLVGIFVFGIWLTLITNDYQRIIALAILLAYSIFVQIKRNTKYAAYFIFLFTNLIFLQYSNTNFNDFKEVLLGISILSMLFSIPALFNFQSYPKTLNILAAATLIVVTVINIPSSFDTNSQLSIVTGLTAAVGLGISNRLSIWAGNIAGLAFVTAFWNLFYKYELDWQYYMLTLSLYMIFLSLRYQRMGKKSTSLAYELGAYLFQSTLLLIDSIFRSGEDKIITGLLLILLSLCIAIMGSFRKNKALIIIGISYLILELVVRLYVVIIALEWWMYLLIVGILLIVGAIFLFIKSGTDKK